MNFAPTDLEAPGGRLAPAADIILINERNHARGAGDKDSVHRQGLLHRAFSVFLTDPQGRFLLQRRSQGKYHSAGLWANACCGHPSPGERTLAAAQRRTFEELGLRARLSFGFFARYEAPLDGGMIENELVYVYSGRVEGAIDLDPDEVDELRFATAGETEELIADCPGEFAYWIRHYFAAHRGALHHMGSTPTKAVA